MSDSFCVHVVDDEEPVRRSIAFLLKSAGYTVQLWESGIAFLREARSVQPGCILLDIRMPEMEGLEVQEKLTELGVTLPVIVLTGHGDISQAVRAMRAGAVDFLEKPFDRDKLLDTIAVAYGQLRDAAAHKEQGQDARAQIEALTAREREVLAGLACGYPNKTIAYDLNISPRTVEVHRANLMTKLGVSNFADALRIAFAAGLGNDGEWQRIVEARREK
jgi:two-component system response regulator FixJ